MRQSLTFQVPGPPKGKARPRVTRYGAYTPKSTAEYERLVKSRFKLAQIDNGFKLTDKPVRIAIVAYFPIVKSTTKTNRRLMLDGYVLPTKKPDFDNIAKIICDPLNKLAYADDSQIVECQVKKKYYGGAGCVCVLIEEVNTFTARKE